MTALVPAARVALLTRLRRFLRSPRVVTAEVLALAALGALMTVVPQATDREATQQFQRGWPALAAAVRALELDRVVHSWVFLALVSLAAASLLNVLVELWRRALREYREPLCEASFRSTPWRRVVQRPAGAPLPGFHSSGRLGVFGTPLFHVGLLAVVLAGLGRALFASEAVVELTEGETLDPAAPQWVVESHGPLAPAFAWPGPLGLERVESQHYPSGDLQALRAQVATGGQSVPMAINAPFDLGARRLYLLAAHGPAALLRLSDGHQAQATLLPLRHAGEVFEGTALAGALVVRLRGRLGEGGRMPQALEVRALREGALLFVGTLAPGQAVPLPAGGSVELADVRTWATFQGSVDLSQYLAYLGFALMVVGGLLMFAVVKVDTAVVPSGEGVLVALKASRFTPAYQDQFERLLRSVMG